MSTIALDATYAVDAHPSGVAMYSRRLIESLLDLDTPHRFLVCYRLSRFRRRRLLMRPRAPHANFSVRWFQEGLTFWLPWEAELFHSLAQRPPAFHFRKEVVTIIDLFPITGRDYSTPDFQRKFSALLLEAAARATLVITPSQFTTDQLLRHSSVAAEKVRLVPFGVDLPPDLTGEKERARERESLVGRGNEMLLSIGAIQTRKNTLNALRALELLPARYRLVLAGADGYGAEAVHEFIRKQRLESRVTLLGYVTTARIRQLYQAASIFLFPSLEEGFGLPVLEAMSYGLPVVASGTSSLPEVGGDAALYVDPHDPHDIAEKVERAADDAEARRGMIEKGLARAREFTWRRCAEGTLKVYDEALSL
ncbi:MAG TPA: glycosyltransferase family 1 protein [Terriglobia bacterium]|nr:glycosyltransferase family 1 protein [Terriglobia bacterium]